MNIHTKSTSFTMSQSIENYLNKKLKTIKKLLPYVKGKHEVWVELSKTTRHHHKGNYFEAKIDIILKNRTIHAEERSESIFSAIDKMEIRIIRELKHYKDKFFAKERRQARTWKAITHFSPLAFVKRKGGRNKEEGI